MGIRVLDHENRRGPSVALPSIRRDQLDMTSLDPALVFERHFSLSLGKPLEFLDAAPASALVTETLQIYFGSIGHGSLRKSVGTSCATKTRSGRRAAGASSATADPSGKSLKHRVVSMPRRRNNNDSKSPKIERVNWTLGQYRGAECFC